MREFMGVLMAGAMLFQCASSSLPPLPDKDLANYQLDEMTHELAPRMQEQLLDALRYDSPAFEVKPGFVFWDEENRFVGPPQVLVTRHTFVHLVLYHRGNRVWSGSILFDPKKGTGMVSRHGYQIDLIVESPGQLRMEFKDTERVSLVFDADEDRRQWLNLHESRLFFYHYTLPGKDRRHADMDR